MKTDTEDATETDSTHDDQETGPPADSVAIAFLYLREAMDFEKGRLNEEGAYAMHHGDYTTVTAVMEFSSHLQELTKDTGALFEKWRALGPLREPLNLRVRDNLSKAPSIRRVGKLSLKNNPDYCRHILTALVSLGGTGAGTVVIELVRSKVTMHYAQLQGARAMIGRLGLVKGIQGKREKWTITNAGKAWLEENPPKA